MTNSFDVVVIGGGHAACESAHAAARLGCNTALVVVRRETIARMSCNPAVGGPGKSQIVREIDALGGLMARVTDKTGLQYRTLNSSKGAAVRANRVQSDTAEYESAMREELEKTPGLSIIEGEVGELESEGGKISAVVLLSGEGLLAKAVVVCTGTFLNGLLHTGMEQTPGGRYREQPSCALPDSLKKLGFTLGRLKTGTPPRLNKNTIDFSALAPQGGDEPPPPFSFFSGEIKREQTPCHLTHTNEKTHSVIRAGFETSPLYTGVIKGVGPRYCPSIEDKVMRFRDKTSHHIFLEPVSRNSPEIYPNGISTSLSQETQEAFLKTIPGLEDVEILKAGYAVEYDFAHPTQLYPTLETKKIGGLFFAGQINGTSGYEEAAGQGLLAGINAALGVRGEQQIILKRSESYIGVLVDDLTTHGTEEPYRMFTSRAEHRLVLRQDNADERLCGLGHSLGLLDVENYRAFLEKRERINSAVSAIRKKTVKPDSATLAGLEKIGLPKIDEALQLDKYLRRPDVTLKREGVAEGGVFEFLREYSADETERAEIEIKYEGYIGRQNLWIKQLGEIENIPLERDMDYANISGLSIELRQKLDKVRPVTFGQASRMAGMTPAALAVLMITLKSRKKI
ncbi:MAG: tRNA uridine-5-carboxymethylaminomethyl(34) synthesis enzyme MnmG [Nitrospinae bacterium]|nr:tRNA uridine-5-carboxymethylaminomethyl(34) synthesis enzyme MnmG [Nitrospinota bacterium]